MNGLYPHVEALMTDHKARLAELKDLSEHAFAMLRQALN